MIRPLHPPASPRRTRLPRTVIVLGLVSLFNDIASDIVIPLIPILLATVLGAGPVALGLIEGTADAVASLLRLWSGRFSDLLGGRRKGLTVSGYVLSNVARPLLALAGSWAMVLVLRSVDRVGKGLRSAPRDALVADATPVEIRGYAYGFHRALDNAGAVGGALIAAAVLAWSGVSLTQMILLSAIPGFIAVLVLVVGIREDRPAHPTAAPPVPELRWGALSPALRRYLVVLTVFTFARASETFILLLGHELGVSTVELLLLWAALSFTKALTATRGGQLADRVGRGAVIVAGWTAFALCFVLFGTVSGSSGLWIVAIVYGLSTGIAEGPERALVGDFAGAGGRGTAFGWYHLVSGLAAIPAGLLFGGLWHYQGAAFAFFVAGGIAAIAALLLRGWAWPRARPGMASGD
ncbi:MAG: MFS transporter [Betaproteobacteria bacterium]|nr:MFS transporter [Betaproteobacteria bacterium]